MTRLNDLCSMRNILGGVIMLSAILLCGCSKRPKGVLREGKMVSLMADLQLAEAYSNTAGMGNYNSDSRENLGKGVLAAHGVTQEEVDSTLAWYGRNMDDYTELFAKVDKEIMSRRKKLMKEEGSKDNINSADMLWPYQTHGVLSALGNSDAWILSLESPDLSRGDVLEWSIRMSESSAFTGVLGVEYADGTSDALSQMLSGKQKYELRLQTDTGKTVSRIYGTLRLKDSKQMPIYADSIMLRRLPFDSLEYHRHRSLRHYGAPARIKPKVEKKDTTANDTVPLKMLDKTEPNKRFDPADKPKPADNQKIMTINPLSGRQSVADRKELDKKKGNLDKSKKR